MGAEAGYRQVPDQHRGERLEHQGVASWPEVDLLAVRPADSVKQAEAKITRTEVRPKTRLLGRSVAAVVPVLPLANQEFPP